ncbi:hypothetical protein ACSNOK_28760 [Streptomyces sp. URMC 126]|uniref:hypothetical protein n=1 Tax=Streptomyces sp. URMC 126 TaxID=3423401 RepID=UPI003F1D836D
MRIRPRVAAVTASLALAGGAAVGLAAPAQASAPASTPASTPVSTPASDPVTTTATSADFTCDAWRYRRDDNGHGASITCYGSPFTAYVVCHRADGIDYIRFGDRVRSGRTSTAWCDLNGEVTDAGAFPG